MLADFVKKSWLVVASSLVFGSLVAGVYGTLEDRIAKNAEEKLNREMQALLTTAKTFEYDAEKQVYVGKDADGKTAGYALTAEGGGFADKIGLLIATDAAAEHVLGIVVLSSSETPGFGDQATKPEFKNQFIGAPTTKLAVAKDGDRGVVDDTIIAITGATITSEAVVKIVNDAVIALKEKLK